MTDATGRPGVLRALLLLGAAAGVIGVAGSAATAPGAEGRARTVPSPWGPIEHVEGAVSQPVLVRGTPYGFFRVAKSRPIRFSVRGPARLAIVSRAEVPADAKEPIRYSVLVRAAHFVRGAQSVESSPAPDVRLADSSHVTLCESRRLDIPVDAGEQEVWISENGAHAVYVRIVFLPPDSGAAEGDSVAASDGADVVPVVERGATRAYYRVTPDRPVRFHVVGPARLEIVSRLDLDPSDRFSASYALILSLEGRAVRAVRYTTVRSRDASYAGVKKRVPSKEGRAVLLLEPGAVDVSVSLAEPRGRAVVVRAARLSPAVGGED
jgi:hypothetical protein